MSQLICPLCKSKVYDNRSNKKSSRSPDFVCSCNDPKICSGHNGKFRKSWWLDSNDLPSEWVSDGLNINRDLKNSSKERDLLTGGLVDEEGRPVEDYEERYKALKDISSCRICGMIGCKSKNSCS